MSFTDKDNITWLIPLSSQVDNYKEKIKRDEEKHRFCLFYHIGRIMGIERAFLIGNMFPITSQYIKKPYTFSGVHYVIENENLIKELRKRAKRYILLVEQGKLRPNVDIMSIRDKLKDELLLTI